MTAAAELVGTIAAAVLAEELAPEAAGSQGTGRFALDLNVEQAAAVARAVLADPALREKVEVKLPARHFSGQGLPEEALTRLPATWFRNADCPKAAFLLAQAEHDEEASLNEVARLGPAELLDRLPLWVRMAAAGLHLPGEHLRWWEKALAGLRDLRLVSLDRFAAYVLRTREAVRADGLPLVHALGAALPALRLPRDSSFFNGLAERLRDRPSAWRTQLATARKRRGGLLLKQTASQLVLGEEELAAAFARVRDAIPEELHPVVAAFVTAPVGWNAEAAALAECEWEQVKRLFDGLQRERPNLARETLAFFDEREPGLLSDEDREYLGLLADRRAPEAGEEEAGFYERHRAELREDRKLKSAWDRFVFGRPVEATDFLAGVAAALEALFNRAPSGGGRLLRIRCERATKRDLRDLNVEAGLYFAHRYAGVERLFGPKVDWEVGALLAFPKLVEGWRTAGRGGLNRSTAKAAQQLRFVLELETETATGGAQACSAQLVWNYCPNAVASQLPDDWDRLARHPFLACRAHRETSGAKGEALDLSDARTFVPAYDRDRGSFVPAYKAERDLAVRWRANLADCRAMGLLPERAAAEVGEAFDAFEASYAAAIRGFREAGAGDQAALDQLARYGRLLEAVATLAKGDRNRELLLKPLLEVGAVPVDGGVPAAVVAPWHPLRLAAMWRKARLVADVLGRLLDAGDAAFGDTRLFFRDLTQDLAHPLYPEVAAVWTADGPQLLSVSDAVLDYSLHEPPVATVGAGETGEDPAEGSACVLDLVRRYLALNPHERANLSVVLFNCDSARLPQAVVDRIGAVQEEDEDVRCQVLLRHTEPGRLRDVYRAILGADATADTYSASEATQDFMARLRVSVVADQASPPDPMDGCPYDIVFSQDVISRHARVEWHPEPAEPSDTRTLLPSRWSRRRPAAADDLKSAAYLCCPVQGREGWAYLTALSTVFRGDWDGNKGRRLLPARQLDFRDGRTARIFRETHDLGAWVANYDELLDRRQLLNQDVRVIRYRQAAAQGRNLIISSRAPLGLLRSMVLRRLRDLALDLGDGDLRALADRLIDDANDVSGDIVLRAARRGQSASELIGVVLSRRLVRDELGGRRLVGWYFLDDYAAWVGQREEQLADLLAIAPQPVEGGPLRVTLAVSEAKYVDLAGLAAKRKESQKQLRDTLRRMQDAVLGGPERLDREAWTSRLADMVLNGIRVPAASGIDLGGWRRAIREGACEFELRGTSHVFVPTTSDGADPTGASEVPGAPGAVQEVFGRPALKRLLEAYWRGESTLTLRHALFGRHVGAAPPSTGGGTTGGGTAPPPAPKPAMNPPSHERGQAGPRPVDGAATEDAGAHDLDGVVDARHALPSGWAYPAVARLVAQAVPEREAGEGDQAWLVQVAAATRSALQQLGMQGKLLDSRLTPNSALLRFAGSALLTVDLVARRRSELLTTFGLNVISIRPEPGAVVLAVERPARQAVPVEAAWARWAPAAGSWGNRDILVGLREDDGSPLVLSPGRLHAPHTLVAGSTGSGKSVLLQNILLGIAATNTPEQARVVLIDPKQGVDYFAFENLPHLDGGIIDDQEAAAARLVKLVDEMDRRYARFKAARTSDLPAYNAKVPAGERMPAIWLVHDEFAEWMLTEEYKEAVSSVVQRLGVKARAAGIHLVFAAQRPDANVMPVQLRDNLGNRLVLRVASEGTSEIALGEKGAERLLGRGHLLARLEGERGLCFAQVPYVDPPFADALATAARGLRQLA